MSNKQSFVKQEIRLEEIGGEYKMTVSDPGKHYPILSKEKEIGKYKQNVRSGWNITIDINEFMVPYRNSEKGEEGNHIINRVNSERSIQVEFPRISIGCVCVDNVRNQKTGNYIKQLNGISSADKNKSAMPGGMRKYHGNR